MAVTVSGWTLAVIMAVNFINIQGRAFQQLNVVHHRVRLIPVASLQMGMCEAFLWGGAGAMFVTGTTLDTLLYGVALGLSGGAGAICSMYLHRWLRSRSG